MTIGKVLGNGVVWITVLIGICTVMLYHDIPFKYCAVADITLEVWCIVKDWFMAVMTFITFSGVLLSILTLMNDYDPSL